MDSGVNPCENFYEFACGQNVRTSIIPDDESISDISSSNEYIINHQLKDILETLEADTTPPFVFLKELYDECLNTTEIQENGLSDFMGILTSVGGWPVLDGDDYKDDNVDWKNMTFLLQNMGYKVDYLISLSATTDPTDYTRYILEVKRSF